MTILKYLDISTGHVTQATMQWLESEAVVSIRPITVCSYKHGVMLTVPDGSDVIKQLPNDLQIVVIYAQLKECNMIVLDSDADTVAVLPIYDWE